MQKKSQLIDTAWMSRTSHPPRVDNTQQSQGSQDFKTTCVLKKG